MPINKLLTISDIDGGAPYSNIGVRDWLLNRNLHNSVSNLKYPNAVAKLVDIQSPKGGEPYLIDDVSTTPTNHGSLTDYENSQARRISNTLLNSYTNQNEVDNVPVSFSDNIDDMSFINKHNNDYNQWFKSLGGNLEAKGVDVLGSILNGQGIGIGAKGNLDTNFDLKSSLAGRVLGGLGLVSDTKLGVYAAKSLALALANNALFNAQQEFIGKINIQDNVVSVLKGEGLVGFRPSYKITTPKSGIGKLFDMAGNILGFQLPKSNLDDSGSIFYSESGAISNILRANAMLENTGKGQRIQLGYAMTFNLLGTDSKNDNPINSPFRLGYAPAFKYNGKNLVQNAESKIYAYFNTEGEDKTQGIVKSFLSQVTKENPIPETSWNREKLVEDYGFEGTNNKYYDYLATGAFEPNKFHWNTNSPGKVNTMPDGNSDEYSSIIPRIGNPKSLLDKTQILFNSVGMKTIVSRKGDARGTKNQLQTGVATVNGPGGDIYILSKGSAVKTEAAVNGSLMNPTPEDVLCRSWTPTIRYDRVNELIRSGGLNLNRDKSSIMGNTWRVNWENSVLDDNGFAKIGPYYDPGNRDYVDPKNYMFSIENLAWCDNVEDLLKVEQGPGDLTTGKKGRIMWFPPYDIQFSESNNVSWESTNFIGRGEPIYTYNNTERSATLSFSVIVDHPTVMNGMKGDDGKADDWIASYFAGCTIVDDVVKERLTAHEASMIETQDVPTPAKIEPKKEIAPAGIKVYFTNDIYDLPTTYENGLSGVTTANTINYGNTELSQIGYGYGIGQYTGQITNKTNNYYNDNTNLGLNGINTPIKVGEETYNGFLDPRLGPALKAYMKDRCKTCYTKVTAFASQQTSAQGAKTGANLKLAQGRCASISKWFKDNVFTDLSDEEFKKRVITGTTNEIVGNSCPKTSDSKINDPNNKPIKNYSLKVCKESRYAEITFDIDPNLSKEAKPPVVEKKTISKTVVKKITDRYYNETRFFEKLKQTDEFIFDEVRKKIKYFHPAFHSTTPEGLNARLTFLLQCTRQGPTLTANDPNNLAFGRPPVCILRIGDFYYTKVVIDNVGITYEPLVWDLNPEGVGVQPMIAKVQMSVKIIGGESLNGPINKLQNALSFNYFANTHVYDARADYITSKKPEEKIKNDKGELVNQPSKQIGDYFLVEGVKNLNDNAVKSQEVIDSNIQPINQMVMAEENNVEETTVPESAEIKIKSFSIGAITKTPYVKGSSAIPGWEVDLTLEVENGTEDSYADAEALAQKGYSIAIVGNEDKTISDYYEIKITDSIDMLGFISKKTISKKPFKIPMKSVIYKNTTEVLRTDGIRDFSGEVNRYSLKVEKDNVPLSVGQKNIKLS
jgi:hypothetical protein